MTLVTRALTVGVATVVWTAPLGLNAYAVPDDPLCALPPCVSGDEDKFGVVGDEATLGSQGAVASAARPANSRPLVLTQSKVVPTCDGNTAVDDVGLCGGAVATCEVAGDVRYWVFRRTVDAATGTVISPYVRVPDPPSVCLGPDDPRVDPTIAIPAIIDRDFQRIVVLKGTARVTPAPDTLVNVETRFATDAPASYEIPLTVLGQSVVITASAASWTWHFGDGTQQRLTDGSSGGNTVHEYRKSGPRAAYVVIEWTGTYMIGGDPTVRQVNGTATTIGEPTQIAVRTARSELVDQPG